MPHVVTSPCVNHKYQECVAVCPVDAFREAETYLVIDPDECIDCGACIPECPVDAIFSEDELPPDQIPFIEINERLSREWPNISEKKEALPEAKKYAQQKEKLNLLKEV